MISLLTEADGEEATREAEVTSEGDFSTMAIKARKVHVVRTHVCMCL